MIWINYHSDVLLLPSTYTLEIVLYPNLHRLWTETDTYTLSSICRPLESLWGPFSIILVNFNLWREENLFIKDTMIGSKCVYYSEVPLWSYDNCSIPWEVEGSCLRGGATAASLSGQHSQRVILVEDSWCSSQEERCNRRENHINLQPSILHGEKWIQDVHPSVLEWRWDWIQEPSLSVFLRGEYEPLLKWPFEHKVSLILILVDQDHRKHCPDIQTNSWEQLLLAADFRYECGVRMPPVLQEWCAKWK